MRSSSRRGQVPIAPTCVYVATVEVIRANGRQIAYKRVGEGPPLLFVHGAAADGRVWQPQLAALADEFTVVAWDEPGAGRSSDVPADFRRSGRLRGSHRSGGSMVSRLQQR